MSNAEKKAGKSMLGKRVKAMREMRGFSQNELAKHANMQQGTLSRLEAGAAKELRCDALSRLSSALGVTSDFLLGKTDKIRAEDVLRDDKDAKQLFQDYLEMDVESKRALLQYSSFLIKAKQKPVQLAEETHQ
ncbi:MAG: helix-turn-helix transcriptional regulator [Nitrososphaerota archaeon]|nr:helix-turn-helix transcriptional regulator [Nitrososphaerota archaeon]